jgi:hypothetical protein
MAVQRQPVEKRATRMDFIGGKDGKELKEPLISSGTSPK